ncbi:hypothetical protein C8J56DRAFT_914188 [Mycena floridula]|nr:hypothetical protein C8J56DRAFT_914188 [Mycena floridula]
MLVTVSAPGSTLGEELGETEIIFVQEDLEEEARDDDSIAQLVTSGAGEVIRELFYHIPSSSIYPDLDSFIYGHLDLNLQELEPQDRPQAIQRITDRVREMYKQCLQAVRPLIQSEFRLNPLEDRLEQDSETAKSLLDDDLFLFRVRDNKQGPLQARLVQPCVYELLRRFPSLRDQIDQENPNRIPLATFCFTVAIIRYCLNEWAMTGGLTVDIIFNRSRQYWSKVVKQRGNIEGYPRHLKINDTFWWYFEAES